MHLSQYENQTRRSEKNETKGENILPWYGKFAQHAYSPSRPETSFNRSNTSQSDYRGTPLTLSLVFTYYISSQLSIVFKRFLHKAKG
jgi:hypothetical protein